MAQGFRARMNNFHSVLIEVLNTAHVMTVTVEKYFEAVSYHHSFVNLAKVMVIRCDKQVWYFAKFVFFFRFPIFQNFVKSEFSIQILQIRFPISCANFLSSRIFLLRSLCEFGAFLAVQGRLKYCILSFARVIDIDATAVGSTDTSCLSQLKSKSQV